VITVLVVGGPGSAGALGAAMGHPSVEVLTALGAEDALEKLARNRRIDAVLLLAGEANREIATAIRQEDPAGPPLFAPAAGAGPIAGVRPIHGAGPEELLAEIGRDLSGGV
jgi:dihydrodipicolinate synthase/N-acetylneuraminate lyase